MTSQNFKEMLEVVEIIVMETIEIPILCPKHQLVGGTEESTSIQSGC